jgi:predicted nucleotidyltransferase
VFDDADTNNPKIKPSVKALIDKQIEMFEEEYPVVKVGLIGSILTKRYRADADLDLNVLFKVPQDKREEERVDLVKSICRPLLLIVFKVRIYLVHNTLLTFILLQTKNL